MTSQPYRNYRKYLLSYKDSLNNIHEIGIYALDAHDCFTFAGELNMYIKSHPNSVYRIQQKF